VGGKIINLYDDLGSELIVILEIYHQRPQNPDNIHNTCFDVAEGSQEKMV
jgi:hypothetical protein